MGIASTPDSQSEASQLDPSTQKMTDDRLPVRPGPRASSRIVASAS